MRSSLQTRLPSGPSQSSWVQSEPSTGPAVTIVRWVSLILPDFLTLGPEVDSVHLPVGEPARALMRMIAVFTVDRLHREGTRVAIAGRPDQAGRRSAYFRSRLDTP